MNTLGQRIKEIRTQNGLTQGQFANEVGISQTHVSKIEKDIEHPSLTLVKFISYKFNYCETWILSGTGPTHALCTYETDVDMNAKFKNVRLSLENTVRTRTGKDLGYTVDALAFLDAVLGARNLNSISKTRYLESLCLALDELERLYFCISGSQKTLPSLNDVKSWLEYKNECSLRLDNVVTSIRKAVNVYLLQYGDEMKL